MSKPRPLREPPPKPDPATPLLFVIGVCLVAVAVIALMILLA